MSGIDKVRVGLIGAGFICEYHLDGIRAAGSGEVTVLAGRHAERAERRAAELGVARWTTDIDTVLADSDIDAVIIATPDATHKPLAIAALQAGKSVLLQKPMAIGSEECRDIIRAARVSTARLSVSFMHRHFPEVRWLRARLQEGSFGEVHGVRIRNATPGATWADWFFDPSMIGGGVVVQLGVHGIDLLQHLFGRIDTVSALASTMKPLIRKADGAEVKMPFEDNVVALYRFAAGHAASHEMCWTEVAGCDRFRLEVYFEKASVWLRANGTAALVSDGTVDPAGNHWRQIELESEPLGRAHHAHWLDVVRGVVPPDDTAAAGLSTLEVAEAIYRSAGERASQSISV